MSENSSKIGKYQFVAEPFHVDFTGRVSNRVLEKKWKWLQAERCS